MVTETPVVIKGFTMVVKSFDAIKNVLANPEELYHDIGFALEEAIEKRTEAGRGPKGVPYKTHYSRRYRRFREEQGLPVDRVYLKWTGGMLGSMIHHVTKSMLRMFFAPVVGKPYELKEVRTEGGRVKPARRVPQKLTEAEKAANLFKARPFFLLDEDDILLVERIVKNRFTKALKEAEIMEMAGKIDAGTRRTAPLDVFGIDLES